VSAAAIVVAGALWLPAAAQAEFGFKQLDVRFENADGSPATEAGSHPFAMKTTVTFNTVADPELEELFEIDGFQSPDGTLRDLTGLQALGLVARPEAVDTCPTATFYAAEGNGCPKASQVGISESLVGIPPTFEPQPLFSLTPPPGVLIRLAFKASGVVPVILDVGLTGEPPYRGVVRLANVPDVIPVYGSTVTLWGVPADAAHNDERSGAGSVSNESPRPFLTLPRACSGPLSSTFSIRSWEGDLAEATVQTHDGSEPPLPLGMSGCEGLPFNAAVSAQPTSEATTSPTGLDFAIDLPNEGILGAEGRSAADIARTVVTLPEGFTANPAIAAGLEVCTEAQLADERLDTLPGQGCPQAAKIGTVEAASPLIADPVRGSIFIAEPYRNPFGSLIAFYFVLRSPRLGLIVRQAAKVEPDPLTGRLTTTTTDMPQLPLSRVSLHFREGARSPLVTPPACGTYDGHDAAHEPVRATLYPSSGAPPLTTTSSFTLISAPGGTPCPVGGLPPFHPTLEAGTLNNAAGAFSPFAVRLSRTDSEQEFTNFSIKLPPGVLAKLAGVGVCTDAQIALARSRTGPHGGAEELADPSCPAASQVGSTFAGAGVGPALTYAPGRVYLAGPYHGAPISFVAITAGVVGPFDIGTVVVRLAIRVNPRTGEVFLDSTGSDPIPHIIKGVPVHLREVRADTDRPGFTFNPTSCARMSTAATVLGSGLDFASPADDNPFVSTSPFQAASCAALQFKPRLDLRLLGGAGRGAHPRFRARLTMPAGDANVSRATVTLPDSAFLDQSHIRTVCTRVQYAADQCPAGAIYGYAEAVTPLLDAPLTGPVYLRSSDNRLPDLVAALRSREGIRFELVGRVDSLKGRIRNTFDIVPDAPVDSFTLTMQGGSKGLIVNSRNVCIHPKRNRARAEFQAHNGRERDWRPLVRARCGKEGKRRAKRSSHRRGADAGLRNLQAVR
jgi:hypothetical protein